MIAPLIAMAFLQDRLVIEGGAGAGKGIRVVLLAGDEEYRSEEGLPQLAKILANRHGFTCTVLFSQNSSGEIDPDEHHSQPGMEALDKADLCIMLLRFREWPDDQMKHFVDYYLAGKPIIALRTSTHAFAFGAGTTYARFGWNDKSWPGGFGKQVLGETWISHWGNHGSQATRGMLVGHGPILRGVSDVFGTTDVYEVAPPSDAEVLLRGQVLSGMSPDSTTATGTKKTASGVEQGLNDPMMPIAWTRIYRNEAGKTNRIFTTTMGAATDLLCDDLRRLLVNAAYWAVGRPVPRRANVDLVGKYEPSKFGFEGFRKGVRPADLRDGQ